MTIHGHLCRALTVIAVALPAPTAHAQGWPDKPMIRRETDAWAPVIRKLGVKID